MTFKDYLKQLGDAATATGKLSITDLTIAMALALLAGLFIFAVYKRTFNGVLYSRNFNISLVMLTLVTTLVISTVTSNLMLSLGMVGALSIVRFRTAVKEPMDTVFMFWAVGVGIALGAGRNFFLVALVGTLLIGLVLFVMHLVRGRGNNYPYLLIVRHDFQCVSEVNYALHKLPRNARLKSKTVTQNGVEITMELRLPGENTTLVNDFLRINGVFDATLVSFQGDYGA